MPLRVASLDYLGVVAAKLRRDALSGRSDVSTVKSLVKRIEETAAGVGADVDQGKMGEADAAVVDDANEAMEIQDVVKQEPGEREVKQRESPSCKKVFIFYFLFIFIYK